MTTRAGERAGLTIRANQNILPSDRPVDKQMFSNEHMYHPGTQKSHASGTTCGGGRRDSWAGYPLQI